MKAKIPDLPLALSLGKEGEELFELLADALSAGEGFELYFVCSANRHVLNEVQRRIESDPIPGVSPRILDYHEAQHLKQLLPDLLAQGHPDQGRYAIAVKADGAEDELAAAWTNALVVLNEQRNRLIAACPSAIVLLGSPRLAQTAQRQAPDLWSVRSSAFMLPDLPANRRGHFSYSDPYSLLRESDFSHGERDGEYYADLAKALEGSRGKAEQLSRANLLLRAANAWGRRGSIDLALDRAREAERIYFELERPEAVFNSLYAQSDLLNSRGEYDRAIDLVANRLLPMSEQLRDEHLKALSLGVLADALEAQGDLDEALRLRQNGTIPIFRKSGNRHSEAKALRGVAAILLKRGQYEEAKKNLAWASAIFREIGDRAQETAIVVDQAVICFETGDFKHARQLYQTSLIFLQESGSIAGVAAARIGIARLDIEEGNLPGARENINAALNIFRDIGDKEGEARALHEIASVDLKDGRLAESAMGFQQALAIRQEIGDRIGEAMTLAQLSAVAWRSGQLEVAIRLASVAYGLLGMIGDPREQSVFENLFEMAQELGMDKQEFEEILQISIGDFVRDRCADLVGRVIGET